MSLPKTLFIWEFPNANSHCLSQNCPNLSQSFYKAFPKAVFGYILGKVWGTFRSTSASRCLATGASRNHPTVLWLFFMTEFGCPGLGFRCSIRGTNTVPYAWAFEPGNHVEALMERSVGMLHLSTENLHYLLQFCLASQQVIFVTHVSKPAGVKPL